MKHAKKQNIMIHTLGKKCSQSCKSDEMLDLSENNFKMAIVNMFTELKETTTEEIKV